MTKTFRTRLRDALRTRPTRLPADPACQVCGTTNSELCSSVYHVLHDDNGNLLPLKGGN